MFNLSKIQIESNSQLKCTLIDNVANCVQSFKDTNRKQFTTTKDGYNYRTLLCSIFQRYKSKAIHNIAHAAPIEAATVFNLSKIQIESNSQPVGLPVGSVINCVQYFKDTNREQFTTMWFNKPNENALCSIFQRYKSRAIHNPTP